VSDCVLFVFCRPSAASQAVKPSQKRKASTGSDDDDDIGVYSDTEDREEVGLMLFIE